MGNPSAGGGSPLRPGWLLIGALILALAACGRTHTVPVAPAPTAPTSPAAASPPAAAPSPAAPATPRGPKVQLLAHGFGQPDDVAVAADGTIYFSDLATGAVARLAPDASRPEPLVTGLSVPEGIVVLGDGGLVVVEQGTNRLLAVDPAARAHRVLRQLDNQTNLEGVDSIAWDRQTRSLLVPDSPNGRLLLVAPDGGGSRVIATGFRRPTDALRLPDGTLAVADETGGAVYRLAADGSRQILMRLHMPDDLALGPHGQLLVTSLDGIVSQVLPRRRNVVVGLAVPHGLAVAPDGSLVVTEQQGNRILRITGWEEPNPAG